jgi:heptaprenyl diphosphate synthase
MTASSSKAMNATAPDRPDLDRLRAQARWLSLLLVAIGLHVFESALPSLGPWFKPGLANIVTLLALVMLGPRAAVTLALGRVLLGSMFIGTLLTPTFFLSLSGTIAATTVILAAWRWLPGVSLVGISLLGAMAHMVAQFVVVEHFYIQQPALYHLLPPMLLLSAATGWINGALAAYLCARVRP